MFELGLLLYGGAMLLLGALIATVVRRSPRQGVSADQVKDAAESTTYSYDPKRFGDTSRLGTH